MKAIFLCLLLTVTARGGSAVAQVHSKSGGEKHIRATDVILPKVGTRFINTYFVTDSSGRMVAKSVVDPEMVDDTQIAVKSGVQAHGRANCLETTGPGHEDTNVYSFAKNGDVYLLNTNHGEKWDRLPFGLPVGKLLKTDPASDTGTMLGKHYEMMDHREFLVMGHDTSSINGTVYECLKLRLSEVKIFEGKEYVNGTTYWFAPELGYIIRENFGWGGSYFLNQEAIKLDPAPGM